MHRVTRLTSLGLRDLSLDLDWTAFPALLTACSDSLKTLHIDIYHNCPNIYLYDADRHIGHWAGHSPGLPFTLSALTHLKTLAIFAQINVTKTGIECPIPEIIRLMNTAPAIDHVVLNFRCRVTCIDGITTLGRLDWSLLFRLHSNFTGTRPPIALYITTDQGVLGSPLAHGTVLDALAGNEVLMGLVKQGFFILKSERTLPLWEGQPDFNVL